MSEFPDPLQSPRTSEGAAQAGQAHNGIPTQSRHCYRIGIIGSESSGKTCLLAALGMARHPNSLGYTAVRIPVEDEDNIERCNGDKWIKDAIAALENGRWPSPNSHERVTVRFQFTDGQTRKKYVEMVDYSGELLNPEAAQADLAKRLRQLLREMDGLVVLAEHPLQGRDSSRVESDLNGLLGVLALLDEGRRNNAKSAERQIPIAMIVNKWDRCPQFDASQESEGDVRVMLENFLSAEPQPFHASVERALRPSSGDRVKSFAVSAVGDVRCEGEGDQACELPPAKGTLNSFGVEEPFLWIIQQRDEIDIAEQEQSLARRSNWLRPPWLPWLRHHHFHQTRSHFDTGTPEAAKMALVRRNSCLLAVRQLALYAVAILAALLFWEGFQDRREHRNAEECIKSPAMETGCPMGTAWLSAYGRSNPFRHILYSAVFLTKQSALDRAIQVTKEKDDAVFADIPDLPQGDVPVSEGRLVEADQMAKEQLQLFPNSPHNEAREGIIAKVQQFRDDLAFEKELSKWKQLPDSFRPMPSDTSGKLRSKLKGLNALKAEVVDAKGVPLGGALRDRWEALLNDTDSVHTEIVKKIEVADLLGGIRVALDAPDYLKAADLLASPEFQKNPQPGLLNEFQLTLVKKLQQKSDSLSRKGENWKDAVEYVERFLDPARRSVVPLDLKESIETIINNERENGDNYLYDLTKKNKNTESLKFYTQNAPLRSMAAEVDSYMQWLHDRATPRKLTFRLVKITWDGQMKKGWMGKTQIKLFVNGNGDKRNGDAEKDPREGITANSGGIRAVEVEVAQTEIADINFQSWHLPSMWGAAEKKSDGKRNVSPEDLDKHRESDDKAGNHIEIAVGGVLPEPPLPPWHRRQ